MFIQKKKKEMEKQKENMRIEREPKVFFMFEYLNYYNN